jgi:RNA-binding protein
MITNRQRAFLRGLANKTEAILSIGKNGVTPEVTDAVRDALDAREIVKLSVLSNCVMKPAEIAEILHGRTRSDIVQVIGKKITLFKCSVQKPVIQLPRA